MATNGHSLTWTRPWRCGKVSGMTSNRRSIILATAPPGPDAGLSNPHPTWRPSTATFTTWLTACWPGRKRTNSWETLSPTITWNWARKHLLPTWAATCNSPPLDGLVDPFVEDWDRVEIRFHKESYWWQRTLEAFDILRNRLDGKMMVAAPTLL